MSAARVSGLFSIASICFMWAVAGWSPSEARLTAARLLTAGLMTEGQAADTLLIDSIRAGQVLIRRLPERLSGRTVEAYNPVIVPATGWLHDRSFFWRVPADLSGTFRFVIAANARGADPDTVFIQVQVSPQ